MRAFDRDLIRGGHYGQRSRQPRSKAEHMAAPTNTALVKKVLANSEPSWPIPVMGIGASFDTPEHDVQIAQAGLAAIPRLRGM